MTVTYYEYIIILAFPRQKQLCVRAHILHYNLPVFWLLKQESATVCAYFANFFRDFKCNIKLYDHLLRTSESVDLLFRKQWRCICYSSMWGITPLHNKSFGRIYAWTKRLVFRRLLLFRSTGNDQLTLWRLTIYIYMSYRTANLQTLHLKYLLNKYTYWIF